MQLFAVNFISLQGHSTFSCAFHTHHQEYIKLYLQPPVQVILSLQVWKAPETCRVTLQ